MNDASQSATMHTNAVRTLECHTASEPASEQLQAMFDQAQNRPRSTLKYANRAIA